MPSARRFPPPWSAELQPNYYVVRDANKQQLAHVYYEDEPGRFPRMKREKSRVTWRLLRELLRRREPKGSPIVLSAMLSLPPPTRAKAAPLTDPVEDL